MGENLSVLRKLEFGLHETIGELARIDGEWADISGDHLIGFRKTPAEHNFEDPGSAAVRGTVDQRNEMGIDCDGWVRWGKHRKHRASDVDACTGTRCLAQSEVLDEEC